MSNLFFIIGGGFGALAGLMAFLITYEEYARHYIDKRSPWIMALQSALFTFVVFLVLVIAVELILSRAFAPQ
jgi:hypothetical protein